MGRSPAAGTAGGERGRCLPGKGSLAWPAGTETNKKKKKKKERKKAQERKSAWSSPGRGRGGGEGCTVERAKGGRADSQPTAQQPLLLLRPC